MQASSQATHQVMIIWPSCTSSCTNTASVSSTSKASRAWSAGKLYNSTRRVYKLQGRRAGRQVSS